jgi:uncharacterized protein (DUF2141 family)
MKTTALAALIAAISAPACVYAATGEPPCLALTFEPSAETGAVMVSLFDSEAAYAGGAPARRARIDIAKGERTAVFADLKPGDYAIKAFHDVNGDGKMNTNPFGFPIEPVAFSNNARPNMGPPVWDLARLAVKGTAAQTIQIR